MRTQIAYSKFFGRGASPKTCACVMAWRHGSGKMAESELNIDSLISRLLEGKSLVFCYTNGCRITISCVEIHFITTLPGAQSLTMINLPMKVTNFWKQTFFSRQCSVFELSRDPRSWLSHVDLQGLLSLGAGRFFKIRLYFNWAED